MQRRHTYKIAVASYSKSISKSRDHFLARFRDICAFFHSKSHENCLKERKNRTDKFSSPITFFLLKAHADHFETFGLFLVWFSLHSRET